MALTIPLPDLNAANALAGRLAALLQPRDCIALQGPLGAGKTTFARALLASLGIKEEVPSPTFSFVQTYETRKGSVYHFDFYRLESEMDILELGWDEALTSGLVLVEWPERITRYLPADRLTLHFHMQGESRFLVPKPSGSWESRLEKWQ